LRTQKATMLSQTAAHIKSSNHAIQDSIKKGGIIMSNAIFFNTYKLKKGASVPDFLFAAEQLATEYISIQKGFISFTLLVDGDLWADFGIFETMEDARNFENPGTPHELALKFYSFINFNSCKSNIFSVARSKERRVADPGVVTFVSFKLQKDASESAFLNASDKMDSQEREGDIEISRKLLVKKDLWADMIFWTSTEGPKLAAEYEQSDAVIQEYLSFIGSVTFHRHFSVEKTF
jgi:hypothetical protein